MLFLPLVILTCIGASGLSARAQPPWDREYQIKAAFLYNFVKFVDWPAEALPETRETVTICVLGEDPFGGTLDQLQDKTVKGKKVTIRRFEQEDNLHFCHVLFIAASEDKRVRQVIEKLRASSVLTVGETVDFTTFGGIIKFTVESNKVRFEVNLAMAQRARLKLSSRLLGVAKIVRTD